MGDIKYIWPYQVFLKPVQECDTYTYRFYLTSINKCENIISKDSIDKTIKLTALKCKNKAHYRFKIKTEINHFKLNSIKIKQHSFYEKLHALTSDIEITISKTGAIISIDNTAEIFKKWRYLKVLLLRKYKGFVVENYLEKLEEKLYNKNYFLNDIKQYRLLGLLWNKQCDIYSKPGVKKITKTKKHLQTIDYYPVFINESLTWISGKEENPINITINGSIDKKTQVDLIEKYFLHKKKYKESSLELKKYQGNYCIDMETGWINEANFEMHLTYGSSYSKIQQIKLKQINR